ncbi:LETM1 domain-containing protein ylh47 [Exophiala xenobiotica]|nr:LETM1 domain-containing protein ylh47 [Exophiala xenobiotica]
MSSGSRLISNAATRRILLQSSSRLPHSSLLTSHSARSQFTRSLPPKVQALAILLPRRNYATETNTHGSDSGPPPGFNIDEAKKPLSKGADKEASPTPTLAELKDSDEQLKTPKGEATMIDKTKALEKATLSELAAKKAAEPAQSTSTSVAKKKEESKKLTIGQKIKKEIMHYWDGTKLLAAEVRISSKLALKMAAGYELSRRENRQLQRTVQDLGRLVPFSVFVIVPFAELLLPVALKLFPNMLPSTYEGQKSRENKAAQLRETRKQVSSFLRNTLRETGLPVSAINAKKEEFTEFFRKVRATGESPSKEDVIKVCKIFKDDLTLDNLSRPQLVGMCKYMNLNTFGTDAMLRYQIRHRMRQVKRDDKAISYEGVDSLSVPELQMACASRGLRTHGMSPGRLREDLQMWLDLRLKYNIPSTLLVLSNAYMYTSGKDSAIDSQIDALQAVLSSIPEELFHEIELEVHNAEGAATNKQRLEVLKEQQELIEEENEQGESSKTEDSKVANKGVKDDKDIDEKPKAEAEASGAAKEAQEAESDISEQGKQEPARKEEEVKKD